MFSKLSKKEFIILLAGLVYLVSPLDAIPELIAGPLGLVDDTAVIGALIAMLIAVKNRPEPVVIKTQ